jgi:anaerobic carbon-monoxide dehydrogenase iron sulfur subunit
MEYIILLDPGKCVGCRQCSLSCSFIKEGSFSLGKARNTVLWVHQAEMFVPMRCQQCEEPPCMDVCPMDALARNEETGAIVIEQDRCIGCKMCMVVCPYGAITWDADSHSMIKCDLCEGDPECVKHCLYGALTWMPADEAAMVRRQAGAGVLAEALSKVKQA